VAAAVAVAAAAAAAFLVSVCCSVALLVVATAVAAAEAESAAACLVSVWFSAALCAVRWRQWRWRQLQPSDFYCTPQCGCNPGLIARAIVMRMVESSE
jgi:hypothetical protein